MSKATYTKILNAIDCSHVSLNKERGYFYFVYDDGEKYGEHVIYVMHMNQMSLESWVEEANELINKVEGKITTN